MFSVRSIRVVSIPSCNVNCNDFEHTQDLRRYSGPTPQQGQGEQVAQVHSVANASGDVGSETSLGSLLQCLTMLMVKLLLPNRNISCCSSVICCPFVQV